MLVFAGCSCGLTKIQASWSFRFTIRRISFSFVTVFAGNSNWGRSQTHLGRTSLPETFRRSSGFDSSSVITILWSCLFWRHWYSQWWLDCTLELWPCPRKLFAFQNFCTHATRLQLKAGLKHWFEDKNEMGHLRPAVCPCSAGSATCGKPSAWQDLKVDFLPTTVYIR